MDKISKRFIMFLAVSLALIPVTISVFSKKEYLTGALGIFLIIVMIGLAIYFQIRKLSQRELIEPEELGEALEEEIISAEQAAQQAAKQTKSDTVNTAIK